MVSNTKIDSKKCRIQWRNMVMFVRGRGDDIFSHFTYSSSSFSVHATLRVLAITKTISRHFFHAPTLYAHFFQILCHSINPPIFRSVHMVVFLENSIQKLPLEGPRLLPVFGYLTFDEASYWSGPD